MLALISIPVDNLESIPVAGLMSIPVFDLESIPVFGLNNSNAVEGLESNPKLDFESIPVPGLNSPVVLHSVTVVAWLPLGVTDVPFCLPPPLAGEALAGLNRSRLGEPAALAAVAHLLVGVSRAGETLMESWDM